MGKPISQQNSRLFQIPGVNLDGKLLFYTRINTVVSGPYFGIYGHSFIHRLCFRWNQRTHPRIFPFSSEAYGTGGLTLDRLLELLRQRRLAKFDICYIQIGENDVLSLSNHQLMYKLANIIHEFQRQGLCRVVREYARGRRERRNRFRPADVAFFSSESDKYVALIFRKIRCINIHFNIHTCHQLVFDLGQSSTRYPSGLHKKLIRGRRPVWEGS